VRDPDLPDFDPDTFKYDVFEYQRWLVRRRYWGPAPYVGRPFCYVWDAFVPDDAGPVGPVRAVAGQARIVYQPEKPQ